MDIVWNILLIVGVFAFALGFPIALTMWEKRLVWPYGPPMDRHGVTDHDGYGERTLARALEQGFEFLGWCDDIKGRAYKISYAMLVSPDTSTLAIIGIGTFFRMPVAGTWLHTPTTDRQHSWISCDQSAGVEADVLGLWTTRLIKVRGFPELWESHQRWIATKVPDSTPLLGFPQGDELNEFHRLRREHHELLARAGYIRFVDTLTATAAPQPPPRWRYTLWGATKVIIKSTFAQIPRRK